MRIKSMIALAVLYFFSGCNGDSDQFEKSSKRNTSKAYQEYLDQYPQGKHSGKARERMDEIEKGRFERAKKQDSVQSYTAYLQEYPNGKFFGEARRKIGEFREKEYRENFAKAKNDARALKKFMAVQKLPDLLEDQETRVLDLYRNEGKERLQNLYREVIHKYQNSNVDAEFKKFIVDILKSSGEPSYTIHLGLQGEIKAKPQIIKRPTTIDEIARAAIRKEKPSPVLFDLKRSASSEKALCKEIEEQFSMATNHALAFGDQKSELAFKIHYTVIPGDNWYSFIFDPAKGKEQFQGIEVDWKFAVFFNDHCVYEFEKKTKHPDTLSLQARDIEGFYRISEELLFSSFFEELKKRIGLPEKSYLDLYKQYK